MTGRVITMWHARTELASVKQEKDKVAKECETLKRKRNALAAKYEIEKQEKFAAKVFHIVHPYIPLLSFSLSSSLPLSIHQCALSKATQQLEQQSDYTASLGCVCGTLLWRTSQNEESIHSMLSGVRTCSHTTDCTVMKPHLSPLSL